MDPSGGLPDRAGSALKALHVGRSLCKNPGEKQPSSESLRPAFQPPFWLSGEMPPLRQHLKCRKASAWETCRPILSSSSPGEQVPAGSHLPLFISQCSDRKACAWGGNSFGENKKKVSPSHETPNASIICMRKKKGWQTVPRNSGGYLSARFLPSSPWRDWQYRAAASGPSKPSKRGS